ncbi:LOW QUALITY PROTEIN: RNA pseudouridylate synthase domain-containing protein 2-like [Microcaecilia unicolor]|uniref:Pseudouridylate synthase RPUSD2 n=1 Tax=Microcaecilia unicolor TaxID=1415580 RepID=A0A6P7Z169_9AMPH|nr:LOW QUALITY PROTEIN: RNA pseudouridylate synthase domain-containing protein 2-like [Microcaecilia unicolor]
MLNAWLPLVQCSMLLVRAADRGRVVQSWNRVFGEIRKVFKWQHTGDMQEPGKRKSEESAADEPVRPNKKQRVRGERKSKTSGGERYVPPPKKRHLGVSFGESHFRETYCYLEGGLRKVRPYYFDFETYCKGRWVGKSLLQIFSSEFRTKPIECYLAAARAGRLRLNEEPVQDLNIVLKNNDFMRNTVHRHEPPVTDQPICILAENEEVVVVDKPSSLPVHPCGRFRHNTVIFILGKEHNLRELHPIHRLDRMTSGVLIFAKTLEVSKRLHEQIQERQLEKEYVCRVAGEFPECELTCEEPILVFSCKFGVCRVDPKGKPCKTVFQRLSYNGKSSVVKCFPYTGRTHQIRVHLQFLGHPIVNDPIYNTNAWGPTKGKNGKIDKTDDELLKDLVEEHRAKQSLDMLDLSEDNLKLVIEGRDFEESGISQPATVDISSVDFSVKGEIAKESCQSPDVRIEEGKTISEGCGPNEQETQSCQSPDVRIEEGKTISEGCGPNEQETHRVSKDPLCGECKIERPDPTPKDLVMYLHALRYKGAEFDYSTTMPEWALEHWQED